MDDQDKGYRRKGRLELDGLLLSDPRRFESTGENGGGPTVYAFLDVPMYWDVFDKEKKQWVTNMTPVTANVKGPHAEECLSKLKKGSWVLVRGYLRTPVKQIQGVFVTKLDLVYARVMSPLLAEEEQATDDTGLTAEEAANVEGSSALSTPGGDEYSSNYPGTVSGEIPSNSEDDGVPF